MEDNRERQEDLKRRREQREKEEREQGITDTGKQSAERKKTSFGRKILDTFLSDDPLLVSERVKNEVIKPGLRDLGYNIMQTGLSMLFYPDGRGAPHSGMRNSRNEHYEDYTRYSDNRGSGRMPGSDRGRRDSRPSYDYGEIIFATYGRAKDALDHLMWCLDRYKQASVADLNEAADLSSKYTDYYYGWYDLRGADIHGVSEGFVLDLPPVETIRTR